ncbi:hypothetical protein PHPALM_30503 [Phytophthora palmivora]|uniref:Uncharacterized protein n=1 Tax=Phytophthora palmivora TaxID=4796 RepID=A0A2P4X4Z4_9STRA|nr:hypothetical protein PHPALM_30503 [Phytophthora palmivora]
MVSACFRHGTLRANEAVENIQLRYLWLHCVEIRERIAYEHDWNCSAWSHNAVQTILKKFRRDFGGCASTNYLDYISLVISIWRSCSMNCLHANHPDDLERRKMPCERRGSTVPILYGCSDSETSRQPTSVINWSGLMVKTTATEDGETTERTYVAKIKPPFQRDEDEITPLEAEELVQVISFSFQLGHTIRRYSPRMTLGPSDAAMLRQCEDQEAKRMMDVIAPTMV